MRTRLGVAALAVLILTSVVPWPRAEVRYRFEASVGPEVRRAFAAACALWAAAPVRFVEVDDTWGSALAWWLGADPHLRIVVDPRASTFGQATRGAGPWAQLVLNPRRSVELWWPVDLAHELAHVVGLGHEHQRPDRDRYVAFPPDFWSTLAPERRRDYALDPGDPPNRPYDLTSITHYSSNIDGNRMVRRDTGALIPPALVPSAGDLAQVHQLYAQEALP